ncbi:MAG: ferrous iron transport protein B [Ignavibacteriaceae bacterium]|jgi:ferrous iron transport protein B|nr:ferrous iron transport protein B [Ignavibacteriaceae bacterium]
MSADSAVKLQLITLVGPPNSGKTTLFNLLSGKNLKTVNYPGSTVEYSIGKLQSKLGINADILDSPGIISLNPNSPDEEISVNYLYNHPVYGSPDFVITTVDASQISRHLLLSMQLIASGFDVIVTLTMNDIMEKRGFRIDETKLSEELGCNVIKVNGRTGAGIDKLVSLLKQKIDNNITELNGNNRNTRVISKKIFENAEKAQLLKLYSDIEEIEKKVVTPLPAISEKNLRNANKSLKILNPTLKPGSNQPDELTLKIDRYLLDKRWGLVFFFLIMSLMFTSIFWAADPFMNWIDEFFGWLSSVTSEFLGATWYGDLIADGVISGTGSVLVFLPQILILFLILGLLEDTGYLARGAMLIDKPLSKIGLNGKSFVPLLSGFACAIPAILSARTISNRRERLLTIFIIPLMSCSARLPVYALLIAFLTPSDKLWMGGIALAIIYIVSIIGSLIVAAIVNRFNNRLIKEEDNSSFILELPAYRLPKAKIVIRNSFDNAKQYIFRAGPVIMVLSMVIWFFTYFPNHNPVIDQTGLSTEKVEQMIKSERLSTSYAADMGKFIQPVMTPLGMDWRVGVALISAFAAREVFVSSLVLIFRVTDSSDIRSSMISAMRDAKIEETGEQLFTPATTLGLIVFFMFALQCLSTVAVSKKETGGWRIPILQIVIFTSTAYILTLLTVNILRFAGIT